MNGSITRQDGQTSPEGLDTIDGTSNFAKDLQNTRFSGGAQSGAVGPDSDQNGLDPDPGPTHQISPELFAGDCRSQVYTPRIGTEFWTSPCLSGRMHMVTPLFSIRRHFGKLKDPRVRGRSRHLLIDLVAIAICGTICGCQDWQQIEA